MQVMKALLVTTCIAILATISYFGWGEWSRAQERQQVAAAEHEFQLQRSGCLAEARIYVDLSQRRLDSEERVQDCFLQGYLTEADVRSLRP